ncbi:MAG TPA: hypothetical protein VHL31_05395 [Geminicoccus sp.]|jgi:hypothetical protein|uniref:hypothetical protein n=1 Tax=Geminicoccus sp. TaxID=2024832 RepID=UPI002E31664A|nr:hypothetical protein [Geminicoccus sp.]HEX2525723.1 hypothetical protein [Geminicoccus sp.]
MTGRLRTLLEAQGLHLLGGFHPTPDDAVPVAAGTVLVVGNVGSAFYGQLQASPEAKAGDPADRWTRRIVEEIACEAGAAEVLFPFDGPPFHPFQRWASRADPRLWPSPLGLLIHEEHGLWHALRAAILFTEKIELGTIAVPTGSPCASCTAKPCLSTCPVGAFRQDGYDVNSCRGHLSTLSGQACMLLGCAARRACPVGRAHAYTPSHAAFHMRAFRAARR